MEQVVVKGPIILIHEQFLEWGVKIRVCRGRFSGRSGQYIQWVSSPPGAIVVYNDEKAYSYLSHDTEVEVLRVLDYTLDPNSSSFVPRVEAHVPPQ